MGETVVRHSNWTKALVLCREQGSPVSMIMFFFFFSIFILNIRLKNIYIFNYKLLWLLLGAECWGGTQHCLNTAVLVLSTSISICISIQMRKGADWVEHGSDLGDWKWVNGLTTVNCIVEEVTDVLSRKDFSVFWDAICLHPAAGWEGGCSSSWIVGTQYEDFTTKTFHPFQFCLNTHSILWNALGCGFRFLV